MREAAAAATHPGGHGTGDGFNLAAADRLLSRFTAGWLAAWRLLHDRLGGEKKHRWRLLTEDVLPLPPSKLGGDAIFGWRRRQPR
jgi:hypothetical protein